jgi:hypothetical protein
VRQKAEDHRLTSSRPAAIFGLLRLGGAEERAVLERYRDEVDPASQRERERTELVAEVLRDPR